MEEGGGGGGEGGGGGGGGRGVGGFTKQPTTSLFCCCCFRCRLNVVVRGRMRRRQRRRRRRLRWRRRQRRRRRGCQSKKISHGKCLPLKTPNTSVSPTKTNNCTSTFSCPHEYSSWKLWCAKYFRGEILPFGNFRREYILIFAGRHFPRIFFGFSRGLNFCFSKWTCTLLVTTKMELYIFAGRTLYIWLGLVIGVYTDDKHGCTQ